MQYIKLVGHKVNIFERQTWTNLEAEFILARFRDKYISDRRVESEKNLHHACSTQCTMFFVEKILLTRDHRIQNTGFVTERILHVLPCRF